MERNVKKGDYETFKRNVFKKLKAKGEKIQVATVTLSGTFNLKLYHMKVQFLDPGGASRDVFLPEIEKSGETWTKFPKDKFFYIFNLADGAEDLVVKFTVTIDGSPTTYTCMTISENEGGVCFSNGELWAGFVGGKT